jgi:hypothetical protein
MMKGLIWSLVALFSALAVDAAQPVEDFHLSDTNPSSPRKAGVVSPRDYLLQVSGYYFGAAH